MAEFDEKLNSILGNQDAMNQIMALAQSLSGESTADSEHVEQDESGDQQNGGSANATAELDGILSRLDPGMIQKGMELLHGAGTDHKGDALLRALRPYLREERRPQLDRALQLAQTMRLIRTAVKAVGGKGESGGV